MNKIRTARIVGLLTLGAALAVPVGNAVADQGNWAAGCAAGWVCMWEGQINGSQSLASTQRDSDFAGDHYANGNNLNNRVNAMWNRFNSTSVRAYASPWYVNGWACVQPGFAEGPYPFNVAGGVSSFKSC